MSSVLLQKGMLYAHITNCLRNPLKPNDKRKHLSNHFYIVFDVYATATVMAAGIKKQTQICLS